MRTHPETIPLLGAGCQLGAQLGMKAEWGGGVSLLSSERSGERLGSKSGCLGSHTARYLGSKSECLGDPGTINRALSDPVEVLVDLFHHILLVKSWTPNHRQRERG